MMIRNVLFVGVLATAVATADTRKPVVTPRIPDAVSCTSNGWHFQSTGRFELTVLEFQLGAYEDASLCTDRSPCVFPHLQDGGRGRVMELDVDDSSRELKLYTRRPSQGPGTSGPDCKPIGTTANVATWRSDGLVLDVRVRKIR